MSADAISAEDARAVLVVDDDDVFRERLVAALTRRGHEVRGASDGESALALARADSPEWAVVDMRLGGVMDGLAIVRGLAAIDPATSIVVLTGYGSIATAVEAVKHGAVNYLPKPADAEEILSALSGGERVIGSDPLRAPSLARTEWEHIQRVLSDCGGNISEAARRLGIHRRSLQLKLHKYPPRQ